MLSRQCERLAQPELVGLEPPGLAAAPFGLVGGDDHRRIFLPQPAPDFLVHRGQPLARVDQEQRDIGLAHRRLGLRAHPPGQRLGVFILEPRSVHHPKLEAQQLALAFAPVAGHAGAVVDQCDALADQAIE